MTDSRQRPPPLILIVEENHDFRMSLALLLSMHGFAVECAEHGQQAIRKMSRGRTPDLVITDLMMPVMDGWQLRQEMLHNDELERVPVVVLSAQDARDSRDSLEAIGYLRKPVDSTALLKVVRAHTH